MFRNVGAEIKGRLGFVVFRKTLVSFLAGVVLCILLGNLNRDLIGIGILATVVLTIIGYVNAREKVMLLYAYGELVECVAQIKDNVLNRPEPVVLTQKVNAPPASNGAVSRTTGDQWRCTCGCMNEGRSLFCKKCSKVR